MRYRIFGFLKRAAGSISSLVSEKEKRKRKEKRRRRRRRRKKEKKQ